MQGGLRRACFARDYLAGIPATGTCTTPPAAFLEPRFSIQIASRETEKLMAM